MIRYIVIYNMSGEEIELNDFDETQNKEEETDL